MLTTLARRLSGLPSLLFALLALALALPVLAVLGSWLQWSGESASILREMAATVPSLSRFAKLGRARVVPVTTRMTNNGYEVTVHSAGEDFPTDDVEADTALMNRRLEDLIATMPAQYFWVHQRFKTRPPDADPIY